MGNTFVVRLREDAPSADNSIQLGALSIVGDGQQVDASSVGRSTLDQEQIDRYQPSNIPSVLATLPGVNMGGSAKPGGQTINIWGLGDAEDVPMTVDGATKSGFERYQQGTIFIEPELIKHIEVEKGRTRSRPATAALAAASTWKPRMPATCCRKVATAAPWSVWLRQQRPSADLQLGPVRPHRGWPHRWPGVFHQTRRRQPEDGRQPARSDRSLADQPAALALQCLDLDGIAQDQHPLHRRAQPGAFLALAERALDHLAATAYPAPPSAADIKKYGYEGALKRFLANRETVDTTWSATYKYQPIDNPWMDLQVKYSESDTRQTDERDATAFFQPSTGGRKMDTEYQDRTLEVKNTSTFLTGPLEHALTGAVQVRRHDRDTQMWMPGKSYEVPKYNYGNYQPYFMPSGKVDSQGYYLQDAITLGDLTITRRCATTTSPIVANPTTRPTTTTRRPGMTTVPRPTAAGRRACRCSGK
jgi:hemoglobin/transferrin/lactoferrin receptor protein